MDGRQPRGAASSPAGSPTPEQVARRIQHTLISTAATREEMTAHCEECLRYGFDAAMVSGMWVPLARQVLRGTSVKVASAVDFPITMMSSAGKRAEAVALVEAGVQELDIGVRIGLLRGGDEAGFEADIHAIVEAVAPVPVKVMLELPLLTPAQRERAVALAISAGASYLKNASAGNVGEATPEQIEFLKTRVPAGVGVKASGGIKTWARAVELITAGADLLGTSSGVAIVSGASQAASAPESPHGMAY